MLCEGFRRAVGGGVVRVAFAVKSRISAGAIPEG